MKDDEILRAMLNNLGNTLARNFQVDLMNARSHQEVNKAVGDNAELLILHPELWVHVRDAHTRIARLESQKQTSWRNQLN